jgi:hypothetical protein
MALAGALGGFKWPHGTALRTFTIVGVNANETVGETCEAMRESILRPGFRRSAYTP